MPTRANILIVDDRSANLLALEAILSDLGEPMVRASSGEEALARLAGGDYAVLLLDVQMPGLSGFETAKRVRSLEHAQHTPIIFLSATESDEFPVAEAYRLGAVDYLLKPFVPEVLRAKVAVFVELFHRGEQIRALERRERDRVEEALRETERRFSRFMAHLPGLAWIKDLSGRYLYANDAAERAFGRLRSELYGKTDEEVFPPDTAAAFQENDRLALHSPGGVQTIETLTHPTGEVRHSLISKFPIPGADGSPVMVGGVAIDVTDRKRAEEELSRQEQWLRTVTDSLPTLISYVGADQKFKFANRAYIEWFGLTPDQVVGLHLRDVLGEDVYTHRRPHVEAALHGVAARFEGPNQHKDLGLRETEVTYIPHAPKGSVDGFFVLAQDVTERRAAAEAVRKSEERYRKLVDQSPLSTQILAPDGRTLRVNRAWEKLWGGTVEEHLTDYNLLTDPQLETLGLRPLIDRGFAGEMVELPPVAYTPDRGQFEGQARWVRAVIYPIRGADGRVEEVVLIHQDITEQRQAEHALGESEERQRMLADNLPSGFIYQVIHSPDHSRRFTYVSAGVEAICGISPADVIADSSTLYGLIVTTDQDRVKAAEDAALNSLDQFDCVFRVLGRGGEIRWLHCRSAPRDLGAGRVVWDGLAIDVTGRRRAEDDLARVSADSEHRKGLYETILSNTPDLAYVFDLEHRFVYANEGLLRMWGKAWDEAIGKTCLELGYPQWHAEMHDREIEQVKSTKQSIRGEVPFAGTFGRRIYEYIFVPVFGTDGEVVAVAGTTRDVTDRNDAAEALVQAAQRKDEFMAMLAHELRNPLAPLRNALQILELRGTDNSVVETVRGMMNRQVTHLGRLVDDLLDVSRITTGKVQLRAERLDFARLIRQTTSDHRSTFEAKGVKLEMSVAETPVWISGDHTRLAQILDNLLTNALKFTAREGEVSVSVSQDSTGMAVLTIRDTGAGIEPEMLARVFDPFSQADRTLDRSTGGLGLGLAIVKGLTVLHGGSVRAESGGLGQGSIFSVAIPTFPAPPLTVSSPTFPRGTSKRLRILVVEDNRDAADSLGLMLEAYGYQVTVTYSGPEGLKAAEVHCPDVVICDVGLPGMDGYQVAVSLRANPTLAAVRLIALTGYGRDEDRRRAKEAGFDEHLTKPADPSALESLLAGSR